MTAGCGIVYDAVFSLGQWCATAIVLKKLGLRSASGPFDWTGLTGRLDDYVDLMTNGFKGYFAKENLRKIRENPAEGTETYIDTVQRWESRHDFRIGVSFEENYARYRARLDRRADRLLALETEKFSKGVDYEEPEAGVVFAVGDFYDQKRFGAVMGNEALVLSVLRRIRMRGRWRNLLHVHIESFRKRLRRMFCRAERKGVAYDG